MSFTPSSERKMSTDFIFSTGTCVKKQGSNGSSVFLSSWGDGVAQLVQCQTQDLA